MMRRVWQVGLTAVAASAALAGGVAAATGHDTGRPATKGGHSEHIVLTGQVGRDLVRVDLGDPVAGPGDLAVFRYDLSTEGKRPTRVGDAYVKCVTQFPPAGSQCEAVSRFPGRGDLTFQGLAPQDLSEDYTIAVTGGTGDFRNVRGELLIHTLSETPFAQRFTLDLVGVR
ncbi:MAG TPA: hypothetical protein VFG74_13210 [Miltoncostaeaceae bacterium]|jgi:hypothetical protein|nr:hypothetical protein [Miltoncostaeaceae bacterium]